MDNPFSRCSRGVVMQYCSRAKRHMKQIEDLTTSINLLKKEQAENKGYFYALTNVVNIKDGADIRTSVELVLKRVAYLEEQVISLGGNPTDFDVD